MEREQWPKMTFFTDTHTLICPHALLNSCFTLKPRSQVLEIDLFVKIAMFKKKVYLFPFPCWATFTGSVPFCKVQIAFICKINYLCVYGYIVGQSGWNRYRKVQKPQTVLWKRKACVSGS